LLSPWVDKRRRNVFFTHFGAVASICFLPNPPLTSGQVDLLKADNVASGTLPGLRELNILSKAIELIVPTYLVRSRVGA